MKFKNKKHKMKNIKVNWLKKSKIKIEDKIAVLTLIFSWIMIILHSNNVNFLNDISQLWKWLIQQEQLISKLDNIKDNKPIWPVKEVTNWWIVNNYEQTKWTNWENLDASYKTNFPKEISGMIEKYKYVSPYDVWDHVSDPNEREKVIFYKRLITTTWATDYCYSSSNCKSWIEWTWTHAWIDIVSSVWTPVYAILDWIIIHKCDEKCDWFWKQIVVWTDFNWEMIATFYWHLNSVEKWLSEWDIIKKWQLVWWIWNTGISSAPHLHLQINKLWKVSELENISYAKELYSLYNSWPKTTQLVMSKTMNPIEFIEKHNNILDDSFSPINSLPENSNENEIPLNKIDKWEININELIDKEVESIEKPKFLIIQATPSKITNNLSLWDNVIIELKTSWERWLITASSKNETLKLSTNSISYNWTNSYTLWINAVNEWNWEVRISDWINNKVFFFNVLQDSNKIFWIKINWPEKIYTQWKQEYRLVAIDKLWNEIKTFLNWNIEVTIQDKESWEKIYINKTNISNEISYSFVISKEDIWNLNIWNYKIKVSLSSEKGNYIASKNVTSDLFLDYWVWDKYWGSIKYLSEKGIVQWYKWNLMPDKAIKRNEIVTILIRNKYWDKYDDFKKQMNDYLNRNWKFLTDIDWKWWYDPYFFMAYKDWIIKWAWWKALWERDVTKAEIITIYWRLFWVYEKSNFVSWLDINENDWYKQYADASKKYNLYPFKDLNYFNWEYTINRIQAFESLYRYINFDRSTISYNSENSSSSKKTNNSELENVVKQLIDL